MILKERFDRTSWSYVITKWTQLFSLNSTHEPDKSYHTIITSLRDIEKRMVLISVDTLAAFILHQTSHHHFHKLSNAVDAQLAVNPQLRFGLKEILELLGQYTTDGNIGAANPSILAMSATGQCRK